MGSPVFVPGLELAQALWEEGVAPILASDFAGVPHAAALIGPGSEVLGLDDATSTDHHWGPRLLLLLRDDDRAAHGDAIERALVERLPPRVRGWSTSFAPPGADGSRLLEEPQPGRIHHRVEVWPLHGFFSAHLAWDPAGEIEVADWLTFPQQSLLTLTSGRVFRDEVGLEAIRARLAWYPRDVWLYLLASCWRRIAQDEHLVARAGLVGDEIGSRITAARLVRDLIRLCFLLERRYAPYAKWLGSAFQKLDSGPALTPLLERVLTAADWPTRERALCDAYRRAAALQNKSGLAEPLTQEPTPFYGRPFRVIHADRFSGALRARIADPAVSELAKQPLIGSLDTWSDSTDLTHPRWRRRLVSLYDRRSPKPEEHTPMAIKVGDRIPKATLKRLTPEGMKDINTEEYFKGRKVVLFAVPGAFTPTCSAKHLPGYVENADKIKAKGADEIACFSVNDAFVMDSWGKDRNVGNKVTMLADGNAEFTKALGLEMDGSGYGMGLRTQRFSALVEDGVVKKLHVEAPGKFEVSKAEVILEDLK